MSQALPLDDTRAFELSLDVNFWARALNQPSLRALQHRDHDAWRTCVMDLVEEARAVEALDRHRPAHEVTDVLVAFVDGLGLQGLVYPELLTTERIEVLLDTQLQALGADRRHLVPLDPDPEAVARVQRERTVRSTRRLFPHAGAGRVVRCPGGDRPGARACRLRAWPRRRR